jgi:hypothetical protein
MAGIDMVGQGQAMTQTYMAMKMYKDATVIHVMADTFKATDAAVAPLNENGPWTVHTRNVQEYVRFHAYA